jgi:hypothetical protein
MYQPLYYWVDIFAVFQNFQGDFKVWRVWKSVEACMKSVELFLGKVSALALSA